MTLKNHNEMTELKNAFINSTVKMRTTAQAFYTEAVKHSIETSNHNWLSDFINTALEKKAMDSYRLRKIVESTNPNFKITTKDGHIVLKQDQGFSNEQTQIVSDIFSDGLGLPKQVLTMDAERFENMILNNIKKAIKAGIDSGLIAKAITNAQSKALAG